MERREFYKQLLCKGMRLTLYQVMFSIIFSSFVFGNELEAQEYLNKKISLRLTDVKITKVLEEVEKQIDVRFVYSSKAIKGNRKMSVIVQDRTFNDFLQQELKKLGIEYTIIRGQVILKPMAEVLVEQNPSASTDIIDATETVTAKTITGKVTDENGDALPGTTVLEKGTANGILTDINGSYSIKVKDEKSILVFSYIGYDDKEIVVGNQSIINIGMTANFSSLNEVVVVGYGTQTKRELTGAISSISSEEISTQLVTGFDQAIAGRMAGVQVAQSSGAPGGSTSIRVRGIGTPGNSEPLYVIDGIPVFNNNEGRQSGTQPSGVLNTINPNDIESIEILKDAASGAIYGSRAANGVVIITTKKGKAGKPRINIDSWVGIQSKEKSLDVLDGPTYQRFIQEFNQATFTNPANTNWQNEIFQTAPMHNTNFSASGGGENNTYLFSLGYMDQQGIVRGSAFDRLSLRLNNTFKVTNKFRFGNNLSIARSTNNQVVENQVFGAAIPLAVIYPPVIPARLEDGSFGMPGDVGTSFIRTNPLVQTDHRYFESEKLRFLGNIYGEYDILKNLTYRLNLGGDFLYGGSDQFLPPLQGRGTPDLVSEGVRFDSREWIWLAEHTLNYTQKIGANHNITGLAGFTQQESRYSLHSGTKQGFISPDLISLNAGAIDAGIRGQLVEWSLMSYLGRVNYSFKDRYFLTGSIRRDGSSRFGEGNRWGVFPSASAGWLISDEAFFKQVSFINLLKVRASWGQLGNQEIAPFQYLPRLVNTGGYPFGGRVQTGFFAPQPANESVTWETSTQTDIGIDLSMFRNRLTFSVDYFDKRTEGILLQASLPGTFGFIRNSSPQFPTVNAGVVRNSGFEFDLGYRKTEGAFQYSLNANFSTLNNNVESLGAGGPIIRSEEALSTQFNVGQQVGVFFGYVVDGVFQNQGEIDALSSDGRPFQSSGTQPGDFRFKDLNNDGVITAADQTYIGNPLPTMNFGVNFDATYKNFDFAIAFQGIGGNQIFAKVLQQAGDFTKPDNKFTSLYENAWRGEGTSNTVPRIGIQNANNNYRNSSYYIHDGAYTRLRNLQVGYSLPAVAVEKLNLTRLRVYVAGQNLLTFDKYEFGLDPEIGSTFDNNTLNGVDYGRFPVPRVVSVGVNLSF